MLGINELFMYKFVDIVVDIMELYYLNVKEKVDFIKCVIKFEEEWFYEILEDGLVILNELIKKVKVIINEINGKDVFKLYDMYGFLIELIEEIVV